MALAARADYEADVADRQAWIGNGGNIGGVDEKAKLDAVIRNRTTNSGSLMTAPVCASRVEWSATHRSQ